MSGSCNVPHYSQVRHDFGSAGFRHLVIWRTKGGFLLLTITASDRVRIKQSRSPGCFEVDLFAVASLEERSPHNGLPLRIPIRTHGNRGSPLYAEHTRQPKAALF